MSKSAHPFDQARERNRQSHEQRIQRFFWPQGDPKVRTQRQKQSEHAQRQIENQRIQDVLAPKADGLPGCRIFVRRCPNLVRQLQSACYATSGNPEDIGLTDDHAIDALRHALGRKKFFVGECAC